MRVYDETVQARKDAEMLRKYDKTAKVWKDAECALKYNGEAWEDVWNAVPDGALIWNYEVVSDELTGFTQGNGGRGTVLNNSYTDFQIQSGKYNDYYKNRLTDRIIFDVFTIPLWASKLIVDVDFGYIPGGYELKQNEIQLQSKNGSGNYTQLFSGTVPNNYSIEVLTSAYMESYLCFYLNMHTGSDDTIPSSPFYVTIKIKNMYFV